MRPFILLATAALLSASAAHDAAVSSPSVVFAARDTTPMPAAGDTTVREYRGSYSSGYEISWFHPCDAPFDDALWWVTLTEEARLQRDSLMKLFPVRPRNGLAVVWRATVSPKLALGAGHMARGTRYMLVTRIISMRALDESGQGACAPVSRTG